MTKRDTTSEPGAKTLADLSALADGTLDPARASVVREQIARDPELSERYQREQHAVAALSAARSDFAPPGLRARIEADRRRATRPRRRVLYGGTLATAVAAAALALILLLPGGAPGAPSVSQAAALSLRGPTSGAPAPSPMEPRAWLNQNVQDTYFPNWQQFSRFTAAGQRSDELAGHHAVTVYYERAGTRIAYTIVSTPALRRPGAPTYSLNGTKLQSFRFDGRVVVTWQRAGHTCILSGSAISAQELSRLAGYRVKAPSPS